MFYNITISRYLTKLYIRQFLILSSIVCGILLVSNSFDLLQKFKNVEISSNDFWKLLILKIPYLYNKIIPITTFLATISFILLLIQNRELLVILCSGFSIIRFILVPTVTSFLIGILTLGVLSPLATFGQKKYEGIKSRVLNEPQRDILVSKSGIFLFEKIENHKHIIQAKSINLREKLLLDATILIIDDEDNLEKRIDASSVLIEPGMFVIKDPLILSQEQTLKTNELIIATDLSIKNLIQRLQSPEMIYVWDLPDSIKKFALSGLAVTKYELFYNKLLFTPFIMLAMSLIACCFITLNIRNKSYLRIVVIGLVLGLCTYFFLEIIARLLASMGLPMSLAVLLPIIFIILFSNFVILHFQEA